MEVMKHTRKIFGENIGTLLLLVLLIITHEWVAMIILLLFIIVEIINYFRNITLKDYIDYLEKDRDKWHRKYIKDKYGIDLN